MSHAGPSAMDVDPSIVEMSMSKPRVQLPMMTKPSQPAPSAHSSDRPLQQSFHPSTTTVETSNNGHSIQAPIIKIPSSSQEPSPASNPVLRQAEGSRINQKRPNQAQRKQQNSQMNQFQATQTVRPYANSSQGGPPNARQSTRQYYPATAPSLGQYSQFRPPHLRGVHTQTNGVNQPYGGWQAQNPPQYPVGPMQHQIRPQPQNRRLFDPRSAGPVSNIGHAQQSRFIANYQDQVEFLHEKARNIVIRVAMSAEELASKEQLRLHLENICKSHHCRVNICEENYPSLACPFEMFQLKTSAKLSSRTGAALDIEFDLLNSVSRTRQLIRDLRPRSSLHH